MIKLYRYTTRSACYRKRYVDHEKCLSGICLAFFVSVFLLSGSACQKNSHVAEINVKVASLLQCDATEPTVNLVKETAKEMNLKINFQYVPIRSAEEATTHRHVGSPTILINGLDIDPSVRNSDQFGIS